MNEIWNHRFIELAEHVAQWSKDPSRKVGAVITNGRKQVLSLGYNGFPRGINDDATRYEDRDTKLMLVSHAERNALDNAPFDLRGATLYSTMFPCTECAKGIIQRGISIIVTRDWNKSTSTQAINSFRFDVSEMMFSEAGVMVVKL